MGSQDHGLTVCTSCGVVAKLHGTGLAGCATFTPAQDDVEAAAATEAARSHQQHREATYKALRRAVASWRLDEARRLLEDLIGAES